MGLDFVQCDAHWSYSGFHRFRFRLAAAAGLDLEAIWDGRVEISAEDEPLIYLLNHSDCDGIITAEQCSLIAPRLQQVIEDWPVNDYDRNHATILVRGMYKCARSGTDLEFC